MRNDIKDYLVHGEWKEENWIEMKNGSIKHRINSEKKLEVLTHVYDQGRNNGKRA